MMSTDQTESSVTVSPEEFEQIERLLGRLLSNSDEREQRLILQIHKRVRRMQEAHQSQQSTLDYLKNLVS